MDFATGGKIDAGKLPGARNTARQSDCTDIFRFVIEVADTKNTAKRSYFPL